MEDVTKAFEALINVMHELREKCPWDKKQTKDTLRYLTIEECYELSDAIIANSYDGIKEELGDMLLHIIFYSVIANEKNKFTLSDVINSQRLKLIERHPHIYGDVKVNDVKDVKRNWELLKLKEKNKKSILSGVPKSLPTMLKSYRILEKVKGVGFDFENSNESLNKVIEEINEFNLELNNNNDDKASDEFGDILFALISYAQNLGINAVNALEKTNEKFIKRFHKMEEFIAKDNKHISDYSKKELNAVWNNKD